MSFPGIFRKLFENEGAGPLLRKEIIPPHADTHGAKGSDPITPESIGAMAANAKPGSASSADVAVKLKTSRAIDGMGFDGTKSIIHYAVCSTAAATAAKTVNLTGFVLEIGARILVRFDTTNTAVNPTLNVNGTGAKTIRYKNATVTASVLAAKSIREFVYDGAYWQIVGDLDSNTTYQPASAVPLAPGTAAVGTSVKYAREDHRHPLQTSVSGSSGSCTGNAATATELATSRAIDGVNFDGSAAITHYAECSTAAATAAKAVSLTGFTLVKGAKVTVRFTVTNTAANPTLNVGGTGAKAIHYRNAAITAGALAANRTYTFVYDGSSWELVGDLDTNTTGKAYVSQTWRSGTNWYRKWSDGFIEQGGYKTGEFDETTKHNLNTPFTNNSYTILVSGGQRKDAPKDNAGMGVINKTTTYFTVEADRAQWRNQIYLQMSWIAYGY